MSELPVGAVQLGDVESAGPSVRLYLHNGAIIVTGRPQRSEDENAGHNCDDMGCGWEHVIARLPLPPIQDARSAALEEAAKIADDCVRDECSPAFIARRIRAMKETKR